MTITDSLNGHVTRDFHATIAVEGPNSPCDQHGSETHREGVARGSNIHNDQPLVVSQKASVVVEQSPPAPASDAVATKADAPVLADPLLTLAADVLDDLERVRIANENRLRQLTRDEADVDGEERGFGLDDQHPDVKRLAALVEGLVAAEHSAVLNIERMMRAHPLGLWVKAQRGIGDKQAARLLASIGDPYWNTLHDRPRTVSELWSYCGYGDAAAQVRRKGQKANWSDDARKRAWLISASIIKAGGPWREIYDETKVKYAEALHERDCVRCGPKGQPALIGSPLSAGHKDARARRKLSKEVLRGLWLEAQRLHEEMAA